jgi:hypothetical protein
MTIQNIEQILKRAGKLSPTERLMVAGRLIQSVRSEMPARKSRMKWRDAAGLLVYPALGEDAQSYISNSRRTDDDRRLSVIRDGE